MRTVDWRDGKVVMIDQRRLPDELVMLELNTVPDVAEAIRDMAVRGAPAIGATAAFGVALAARNSAAETSDALKRDVEAASQTLLAARPTASNLSWAVRRVLRRMFQGGTAEGGTADVPDGTGVGTMRTAALDEARRIADEDVEINRRMAAHGAALLPEDATVIHHCNTGSLATVEYGTALGVVRAAHEDGKRVHVLVDETRPRLQGARLTAWELARLGVPQTLIADGAAGWHLQHRRIDAILVGADRVAANGDTANKIGTYPLAVLADVHGVPLYVVAPTSTIDLDVADGEGIPIEQRSSDEVTHVGGHRVAPAGVDASNPAFDVTPQRYIAAIVTEEGVVRRPYGPNLRSVVQRAEQRAEQRA